MNSSQEELKAFLYYLKDEPLEFEKALLHSVPYEGSLSQVFLSEKTHILNFHYQDNKIWEKAGFQNIEESHTKSQYDFVVLFVDKNKKATKDNLASIIPKIRPSGQLIVISHVKTGAKSLPTVFNSFGLNVKNQTSKHHCKIYELDCSQAESAKPLAPSYNKNEHGYYSRAGIYGFDKIDIGSKLLNNSLPEIQSPVADLGCGYGYLSSAILRKNPEAMLCAFDNDLRAVEACRLNLVEKYKDKNWKVSWWDLRNNPDCQKVKTVVMNPPFHEGKSKDITLGQQFIHTAYEMLSSGGKLYMVANTQLPYEKVLENRFGKFSCLTIKDGFKILMAEKV